MCDTVPLPRLEAFKLRLTLFETAGCATRPQGHIRIEEHDRLTLFETAGCATALASLYAQQAQPPHALRNRGMCDSGGSVGAAQTPQTRLTLFETAGCATTP
mgnify:CR=1 FL=1